MFGRQPRLSDFFSAQTYDTTTYQSHFQVKLAELQRFVKTNQLLTRSLIMTNATLHLLRAGFLL